MQRVSHLKERIGSKRALENVNIALLSQLLKN